MEKPKRFPQPWLSESGGRSEVNTGVVDHFYVNCSANQIIEIDKLYGPLAAHGVRVRLEFKGNVSDWVVESEDLKTETWKERARWGCQDDRPEKLKTPPGETPGGETNINH